MRVPLKPPTLAIIALSFLLIGSNVFWMKSL